MVPLVGSAVECTTGAENDGSLERPLRRCALVTVMQAVDLRNLDNASGSERAVTVSRIRIAPMVDAT
jgi:hypothetical protein